MLQKALGQSNTCRVQSAALSPWRTLFERGNLKCVILKDCIQEESWEPALSTGPQILGRTPTQARGHCLDQDPSTLLCILQTALPETPALTNIHPSDRPCLGADFSNLVLWQLSLRWGQTWPRRLGQLGDQNELWQLWAIGHQLWFLSPPSYHLKLGEHTCWG